MNVQYFIQPKHPAQSLVWRYMSLAKFIDLLANHGIRLSNCKHLEDKFEGMPTSAEVKETIKQVQSEAKAKQLTKPEQFEKYREIVYISSWHENPNESYAMWKLYGNEGVAIQTTYQKLVQCVPDADDIYIGKVEYIDFHNPKIFHADLRNILQRFMRKDLSFQSENEVRILKLEEERAQENPVLTIDLNFLVEKIYVNPYAPAWYHQIVKLLIDKFILEPNKESLLKKLQPLKPGPQLIIELD